MCNGGFLFGKDAALLIEGFVSPAGASFQYEALRTLSPTPIMGAVDTHDHFDHVTGTRFTGIKAFRSGRTRQFQKEFLPATVQCKERIKLPFYVLSKPA